MMAKSFARRLAALLRRPQSRPENVMKALLSRFVIVLTLCAVAFCVGEAGAAPGERVRQLQTAMREMSIAIASDPGRANRAAGMLDDPAALLAGGDLTPGVESALRSGEEAPLLGVLIHRRSDLTTASLKRLYDHGLDRVQKRDLPPEEYAAALKAAVRATSEIQTRAQGNPGGMVSAPPEFEAFLNGLAVDPAGSVEKRTFAVRNLGALRCVDAAPVLADLAGDDGTATSLRAAALVALPRLDADLAAETASSVIAQTGEKDLFRAAAMTLGRDETPGALQTLVDNAGRFPGAALSVRAAVARRADWLEAQLTNPDSENLSLALDALALCQSGREDLYKPELTALLGTCDFNENTEMGRVILQRLIGAKLTPDDCRAILGRLEARDFDAAALAPAEYEYLDRLARAVTVAENPGEDAMQ